MPKDVVISMCDKTGIMVRPWAQVGYECWCIDLQHSIRRARVEQCGKGVIHFVWGDARSWRPPESIRNRIAICFGFPPCTHLSSSGARDHRTKAGWMLADALQIFDSLEVAFTFCGAPYMLENPVGRLSTHRRKWDYTFQPWEFGDPWFKNTCLWTGNGFVMPAARFSSPPPRQRKKFYSCPRARIAPICEAKHRPDSPPLYSMPMLRFSPW